MGVRSLWRYLSATIVRTTRLVPTYPSETIVIDLLSGCRRYFQLDLLWNFTYMRRRVARDIRHLRDAGFNIIAFTDAADKNYTDAYWLLRRSNDLEKLKEINSALLSGSEERIKFVTSSWRPPANTAAYIGEAFHENGVPVYTATGSADKEGAGLALKYDSYGVLTGDTDFLMFPGIKRFLFYPSMTIENDGSIFVDSVEKSLFLRYIGISEEKLPLIVGFMGNDVFPGVPIQDRKYLEYKWKMDWFAEASAMEIRTASTNLLPEEAHHAVEFYRVKEPHEWSPEAAHFESPYWTSLRDRQVFCSGVAFDNLDKKPCHEVLESLRRSVYARNNLQQVKEHLCHPHKSPDAWLKGAVVEIDEDDLKAPEPPADALEYVRLVCDYLEATGELGESHHRALIAQVQYKSEIEEKMEDCSIVPRIDDIHVASLYLQTANVLSLGASSLPRCWNIFHGVIFHYLCQNPEVMDSLPSIDTSNVFDWTPIVNRCLESDKEDNTGSLSN